MSEYQGQIDAAVRSCFSVKDSYVLPGGEYEYKVAYGPDSKDKFVELSRALVPFGLTPWLSGQREDCALALRKITPQSRKMSRVPVVLALLSIAVILLYSWQELLGYQQVVPSFPSYAVFLEFGASVGTVVAVRYLIHIYATRKARAEANSSYLIPGIPELIYALPTLGLISYQRTPALNRNRYFDLMIMGPAALFLVSVVLQLAGFLTATQTTVQLPSCQAISSPSACVVNPSVIQLVLGYLMGPFLPAVGSGHTLVSPLADGAAIGFLLSFIATLPMASFDGGHLASTLWGAGKARVATYLSVILLLAVDTNSLLYWGVAIVVLLVGGRPLKLSFMDEISGVSRKRLFIYLGLLFIAFLAVPIPHDIATIPLT